MAYKGETKLGKLFQSRRERGRSGLPTLSVTMKNGLINRDDLERKTETNLSPEEHLLVEKDDIAYNMMRMWQGASGLAKYDGIISPAYIVLKPEKDHVDPLFASYLFKSKRMIYLFWAYSYGLTKDRLRLYFNDFKRIPVNVPSISEQQKIAHILFTWDNAIKTAEKLIENSQQQKKALMQRLLTGKERLPGFSDVWEKRKIYQLVDIIYGKSPKEVIDKKGEYPIIGTGGITGQSCQFLCDEKSVVIGRKGTIDNPQLISDPFWPIDTTFYCLPKNNINIEWFYYRLSILNLKKYNEASGVPSLSRDTLYSIGIETPINEEQNRIATTLSNCDDIIKKEKEGLLILKAQKQALMQQLLTGKRRVKIDQ